MHLKEALDGISPLAVATGGIALAVIPLLFFLSPSATVTNKQFPLLGSELDSDEQRRKEFTADPRASYEKGYAQFKDSAFRMLDDFCKCQPTCQYVINAAANAVQLRK